MAQANPQAITMIYTLIIEPHLPYPPELKMQNFYHLYIPPSLLKIAIIPHTNPLFQINNE
jgi:hypothetical protein